MVYMVAITRDCWSNYVANAIQKLIVTGGDSLPSLCPRRQMRELCVQDRRLDAVHPAANSLHDVLVFTTVTSKSSRPPRQMVIVCNKASGIPVRAKIFTGIKRERSDIAKRPNDSPSVFGRMGLGAVFNDPQVVPTRDRHDRVHVRRLTVEMDRNDTDGCRSNLRFNLRGIDREGLVICVAKDDSPASLSDGLRGRDPGVSSGDDLVARFYPERPHTYI